MTLDLSDAVLLWTVKSHAVVSYIKINPQPHRKENSGKCSSDLAKLTKKLATVEGVEFGVDFGNRANSSYWWVVFVRWVRGLFAHFVLERFSFSFYYYYYFFYFTILYCFCHTSTWICHRYARVPHPELPSLLPPYTIPLGHPSAPAPNSLGRLKDRLILLYTFNSQG